VKEPGAILLVACYELGHQPLGVAWPAACLEARGYRPAVMDVAVEPFDERRAARAELVAIAVPMYTALRVGLEVAGRVRAVNPRARLCFYGLYASLNAETLLAGGADAVIGGEVEPALLRYVETLEGPDPAAPVPGVRTRAHAAGPALERMAFPVPSRGGLPSLQRYVRLERGGRRELTGYVEASRGCRHHCRHCPIPPVYGGRFVVVPPDVVLADVRQQVAAGATHVTFGDPDFLNGPRHAFAVAERLHAEFPAVTFDVTAKVEHLLRHRARLGELAGLGCAFAVTAVESLSDVVLGHLDKGHTRGDVGEVIRAARAAGLDLRPTWLAFTPWTTLDDYDEMLELIAAEDLIDRVDPVQYSLRLLVPPGSLLLGSPALRPFLGSLPAGAFNHPWTHPDPRMDALQAGVAAVVAADAAAGADAAATFDRVRGLADAARDRPARAPVTARLRPDRARPPRLTESWFC
jgi:radical SAM superfamily enzyme YgiQ (UPF0313 family)